MTTSTTSTKERTTLSNEEKPTELAKRAGKQGKHAAQNLGRAAEAAAEPVIEHAADTASDVVDRVEEAAHTVSPQLIGRITGDAGVAFLALSVSIYSGTVAFYKFRGLFSGRNAQ